MHKGELSKLHPKLSDVVFEMSPQLDWKHAHMRTYLQMHGRVPQCPGCELSTPTPGSASHSAWPPSLRGSQNHRITE